MSKYYEDLEPGQHYKHAVTRTVTEVDNLMFTVLSHNDQPLHLDEEFGKRLCMVLGYAIVYSRWLL